MRATGQTTKVIYRALMSDALTVFVFAPSENIKRNMMRLFIKHAPKPDKVEDSMIQIGDRRYFFYSIVSNVHQRVYGPRDLDVFYDHSVFDMPNIQEYTLREVTLINEITLHKKAQADEQIRNNSGPVED